MVKKRILIIDDDKQLNKINERVLQVAGIAKELHIALNGKEGLDYLKTRIEKEYPMPDIIILDLDMPVLNGFQFIDEFNKLSFAGKSNIEIVIFSSSSSPKDRQKISARGIKHFLSKPYLLRGLQEIIRTMNIEHADPCGRAFNRDKNVLL